MNIAELLNKNAERFPFKSAVGFKKKENWKELSWKDFRRIVFKTANALREDGVKEGDRVAIFSDNSAEWIVFDLAVLALGAVTVPIYSTNNQDQTAYILGETECELILTGNQEQYDVAVAVSATQPFPKKIIAAKKSVWLQENRDAFFEDFIKNADETFEIVSREDEDLATIIYTSGTTGVPKGVMLTHGNFNKSIVAHFDFFKFKNFEREVSLAFLPLTHVFERSWTLLALSGGAKVCFLENTKFIASALAEVKPTLMCAVPRFYQKIYGGVQDLIVKGSPAKKKIFSWALGVGAARAELLRTGQDVPVLLNLKNKVASVLVFNKIKNKMGGRLWFMPCGGASVSAEVTEFFDAMGIHLTVGYGLTETTATLTAFPFQSYRHGSAGIPLGDTQLKIGENGEILTKGSGIMRGYYKKPEETAEVLSDDGWLKTGDAGEFHEEGNLFITDRLKDLMKTSNGKYIAPQPLENALSNDNFIDQAMIVAEGKPYVTALLIPNFEALKEQLSHMNIPFTDWPEIVSLERVQQFYDEKLQQLQKNFSAFEKIKKFVLMPAEFEIGSGEITPTLKIKRNVVLRKYVHLIDRMYNS